MLWILWHVWKRVQSSQVVNSISVRAVLEMAFMAQNRLLHGIFCVYIRGNWVTQSRPVAPPGAGMFTSLHVHNPKSTLQMVAPRPDPYNISPTWIEEVTSRWRTDKEVWKKNKLIQREVQNQDQEIKKKEDWKRLWMKDGWKYLWSTEGGGKRGQRAGTVLVDKRVWKRWWDGGKGTAAHYQTAFPRRYFKPASGSELDGVSLVGGVPDREGGYRLRGTDECFTRSSQSPRRSKFEWTYGAVLLTSYRY